jgi:hypothetical protein
MGALLKEGGGFYYKYYYCFKLMVEHLLQFTHMRSKFGTNQSSILCTNSENCGYLGFVNVAHSSQTTADFTISIH